MTGLGRVPLLVPVRRRLAALLLAVLACLAPRPAGQEASAQEAVSQSVIQLWVMRPDWTATGRTYRSEAAGTAFFIDPDGRALTASHVLDQARLFPRTFKIIATVGSEFFSARIICASPLPARQGDLSVMTRDVAEVQLVPAEIQMETIGYAGIEKWRAHHGPMPRFRPLHFGAAPAVGDPVRVLGFGFLSATVLPYEWSAIGTVGQFGQASDGTAIFAIKFEREAEPGHSGSPVLNPVGDVVGMFTWFRPSDHAVGIAIGRAALDPACP